MNFRFADTIGATLVNAAAVATDSAGNTYVTGSFSGTANFGPTTLTSLGLDDVFIAKYDTSGNVTWAKNIGGAGPDRGTAIAVSSDGSAIAVAGSFSGTANFNPASAPAQNLTSRGLDDAFVLRLDANGGFVWVQQIGGPGEDQPAGIGLDSNKNVYVDGTYSGTITLGPTGSASRTSAGGTDVFVAALNTSGTITWSDSLGGAGNDSAAGIAVDASSNFYVTGGFEGSVTFGTKTLSSAAGSSDIFLAKYNGGTTPGIAWAYGFGGTGLDKAAGVAVDPQNNVYLAGSFAGTANFNSDLGNPTSLASLGSGDGFVAKYDPSVGFMYWVITFGGVNSFDQVTGIAADSSGAYVTGTYRGQLTFPNETPAQPVYASVGGSGEQDGFALRFQRDGSLGWARTFGGVTDDTPRAIAANGAGKVSLAGNYTASTTFGARTVAPVGAQSAFVVRGLTNAADYDGDGKAELTTYRPSTGVWSIFQSSTQSGYLVTFGSPNLDKPVPGDYDGDGKTDVAVYRTSNGEWLGLYSGGGNPLDVQALDGTSFSSNDKPVPADYDGDGKTDLAIYNVSTGLWTIKLSSTGAIQTVSFGSSAGNDTPVPADYDGDGKADIAVYRPTTGQWLIIPSGGGNAIVTTFGSPNLDKPIPADYDGDGKADYAVYRPTTAEWLIIPSGGGASTTQSLSGKPVRP